MKKQVYDLTQNDLDEHPAWRFLMSEDDDDELTVMPIASPIDIDTNDQILLYSKFTDLNGTVYGGYIYWGSPDRIEFLQPCMFLGDEKIIFWNGMIKPDFSKISRNLTTMLPISLESLNYGVLKSIHKKLEGIYYMDENDNIACGLP